MAFVYRTVMRPAIGPETDRLHRLATILAQRELCRRRDGRLGLGRLQISADNFCQGGTPPAKGEPVQLPIFQADPAFAQRHGRILSKAQQPKCRHYVFNQPISRVAALR